MRVGVALPPIVVLALSIVPRTAPAVDPVPLGPEITVNAGQSGHDGYGYPDVARGADGGFVVVWDTGDYQVFARTFAVDGNPTSPNVSVSALTVQDVHIYPFVDADAAGNFVVVWNALYPDFNAMAVRMDPVGTPQGEPFEVTGTGTELNQYVFTSNVAVRDEGTFVVTWDNVDYYFGSGYREISAQRFDADGTFIGPRISVASEPDRDFLHPTIDVDADGDFVVVWAELVGGYSEPDAVSLQRYDEAGTPLGPQVPVDANHVDYASNPWRLTPVSMNASGAAVVAWVDYDTRALEVQRYDASGAPVGTPLEVTPGTFSYGFDVALEDDGDFVVVWEYDLSAWGRRFDAVTESFGTTFEVGVVDAGHGYEKVTVASTTDDAFTIVWTGDDRISARRFGIPKATGIAGTKLVVLDKSVVDGKAKVVFVAKNDAGIVKGPAGAATAISGSFDVFYTDASSVAGSFVLPSPWQKNDATVAKFVNTLAPGGPTQAKVAVVKDGLAIKVRTKGLGDGPAIDLFAGPPSDAGGITAVLTVVNQGLQRRFCTRFAVDAGSEVTFSEIAGGLGRKLVATSGVPASCP